MAAVGGARGGDADLYGRERLPNVADTYAGRELDPSRILGPQRHGEWFQQQSGQGAEGGGSGSRTEAGHKRCLPASCRPQHDVGPFPPPTMTQALRRAPPGGSPCCHLARTSPKWTHI